MNFKHALILIYLHDKIYTEFWNQLIQKLVLLLTYQLTIKEKYEKTSISTFYTAIF